MESIADKVSALAGRVSRTLPGTRHELDVLPSGVIFLHVWRNGRLFVMYYGTAGRFGVDEVLEDEAFDMGYRHLFDDFDSASAKLLELLASTGRIHLNSIGCARS